MSVLDIKTCTNCGLSKASSEYHKRSLSKDGLMPLAKGGPHIIENLLPACDKCNGRKNDIWPFTAELKQEIATEVRALRAQQGHTIPVRDGLGVN